MKEHVPHASNPAKMRLPRSRTYQLQGFRNSPLSLVSDMLRPLEAVEPATGFREPVDSITL